jgi:hypothetical protein
MEQVLAAAHDVGAVGLVLCGVILFVSDHGGLRRVVNSSSSLFTYLTHGQYSQAD